MHDDFSNNDERPFLDGDFAHGETLRVLRRIFHVQPTQCEAIRHDRIAQEQRVTLWLKAVALFYFQAYFPYMEIIEPRYNLRRTYASSFPRFQIRRIPYWCRCCKKLYDRLFARSSCLRDACWTRVAVMIVIFKSVSDESRRLIVTWLQMIVSSFKIISLSLSLSLSLNLLNWKLAVEIWRNL